MFLNLCSGLDRLGVEYRVNSYGYAKRHPDELACIIGKPHLLDRFEWHNPILFGAAVFSHPLADPGLFQRRPVVKVLVPGEWMRRMCEPYWGESVLAWPVGIDTDLWVPVSATSKTVDLLLYDKVRWEHERYERELIQPVRQELKKRNLSFEAIRYGLYEEQDFHAALRRCRAMIFLCEHETQGIAYQQALSCGVPILAWDRGGFWQDPEYYPERVRFADVSSVPYWDHRCGEKFRDAGEFGVALEKFLSRLNQTDFRPRDYILENLTLELCAQKYVALYESVCRASI